MSLSKKVKERRKKNKLKRKYIQKPTPVYYNPFKIGDVLECHTTYPSGGGGNSRWDLFRAGNKYVVSNNLHDTIDVDDLDGDPCDFSVSSEGLKRLSKIFRITHIVREERLQHVLRERRLNHILNK